MADADFDGLGSYGGRRGAASPRSYVNLVGGLLSLALLVGFAVWGYRLAVRDVRGVPVIRAMEGPMRIAPEDPGGEIADHQGLAVNDVAAVGVAAGVPERLVLAPRPVELAPEDVAGLAGLQPPIAEPISAPGEISPAAADLALAAAPPTESASPTAVAVDAAIAEALGLTPEDMGTTDDLALAEDEVLLAGPVPEGAMVLSPRPRARPDSRSAPPAAVAAASLAAPNEVDPATIPVGTRLVQFGAFDSADEARAEWVRLSGQFGDLMAGKGLVLQPAESGGRTFYRLRAHGFEDEADARRFCSAFVAQNATCIPVPQR
ncbi:MAG: SPOR domain-containing protein [Tabrizicola sp.]